LSVDFFGFMIAFSFYFLTAFIMGEGKDGETGRYSLALLTPASKQRTRAQRSSQQTKHLGHM
jgi:hypothetical protein